MGSTGVGNWGGIEKKQPYKNDERFSIIMANNNLRLMPSFLLQRNAFK